MNTPVLTKSQSNLNLTILNAEAETFSSNEIYLWLRESGLPSELAIRLKNLVETVKDIAGRVISIGKIILIKIMEFVKSHPNMVIGIAIGAAIAALTSMIPVLGPFLAPVVALFSVTVGAVAGHRTDKLASGQTVNMSDDLIAIGQDIIEIAKEFFKLLANIFNSVFDQKVIGG